MPHIVHLTTVHPPFDTRIFHKECRTLAQAGYTVSLLTTHTQRETRDGVMLEPLPRYPNRLQRMARGPWTALRLAQQMRADVYHFHDPELLPVGVLLKWTTKARVIYDAHENYARQLAGRGWMPAALRPVLPAVAGAVEKLCVRFFDAVVCATEHIAEQFPQARTIVLKNYPSYKVHAVATNGRAYAADNRQIIYTGGWTGHRGVYQIVQALEHVRTPGVTLILLGRCIDPHVQAAAQQLPGYAQVDYRGLVPYDELYRQMQGAAIGLVCNQPQHNYDMAQPNKLFEYMSAGLPVIASHFPLWRAAVEGAQCGITVDPAQPQQIARAIDFLLSQPALCQQMGQNGRHAVQTRYNWEVEKETLIHLYEELLQ